MNRTLIFAICCLCLASGPVGAEPPGLLFHVSFDKNTTKADFAVGDARSALDSSAGALRFVPGVKGRGIIMQPGQRCTYQIAKNFDTSQGTFSCWVKPLNWSGQDTKFRHFLAADAGPGYSMLAYLYPCGDVSVWNYIQVGANTPHAATWRAGGPVDMFKRNEWTHLATTWDAKAVRLFANGRRLSEALVAAPLPKLQTGTFTICPVEFWKNDLWGDPKEQTICDEVRIFARALADDEILDLYAEAAPATCRCLLPPFCWR